MTKTRADEEQLMSPMLGGFFTNLPSDCLANICEKLAIKDAVALSSTSRRHHGVLRQSIIKRYLQSLAVKKIVLSRDKKNLFCLTRSGEVWVVGQNNHAQLGVEDFQPRTSFTKIPALPPIKQVLTCGKFSTLMITEDGKLYISGDPSEDNQYPNPTFSPMEKLTLVEGVLQDKKIIKAVDDGCSACFLTDQGEVYVVGYNKWGELGTGEEEETYALPVLIQGIPRVDGLIYTSYQLFLFTAEGVYSCGKNNLGQLGLGDRLNKCRPVMLPLTASISTIKFAAGRFYALTQCGHVYVWGDNSEGWLGLGHSRECNSPTLLTGLTNIVNIKIRGGNCFFVNAQGDVYAFGVNAKGELGFGDQLERKVPTFNTQLGNIQNVCPALESTIFTTKNAINYACGLLPAQPELSLGLVPRRLVLDGSIVKIIRMGSAIFALTSEGALHVFGDAGKLIEGKQFCKDPEIILFSPVAALIKKASVADLLFYSFPKIGCASYFYQQATQKITEARKLDDLINILYQLNTSAWCDREEIRKILPAYHLVLKHINQRIDEREARDIVIAWAYLLAEYRDLASISTDYQQAFHTFLRQQIANPFVPKMLKSNFLHKPLAPRAITIAAEFLELELFHAGVKRALAIELLDDDEPARKKFKKE